MPLMKRHPVNTKFVIHREKDDEKNSGRILCTAIVLLSVLFSACTPPISESSALNNLTDTDENKVIYGASSPGGGCSLSKPGIFRHNASHLKYYDQETKESYVICSKPSCRHSDSGCSGWYEPAYSAADLALYRKKYMNLSRMKARILMTL